MSAKPIKAWRVTVYANNNLKNPVMEGFQRTLEPNIHDGFILVKGEDWLTTQGIALRNIDAFRIEPVFEEEHVKKDHVKKDFSVHSTQL